MQPFFDATPLRDNPEALRARMQQDGYLFLRNLLPADAVANVQRQVGALAQQAGWLQPNTPVEEARANPAGFCVDPEPRYLETLRRINHLEDYHALKHHPALITFLETLLGGPILAHPRVLCRNIFPAREEFTPSRSPAIRWSFPRSTRSRTGCVPTRPSPAASNTATTRPPNCR